MGQEIGPKQIEQIVKIACLKHQAAFHIGLAKLQFRIKNNTAHPGFRLDGDANRVIPMRTKLRGLAARKNDIEASFSNGMFKFVSGDCAP